MQARIRAGQARALAKSKPALLGASDVVGEHTVGTIPLRAVRKEARANALHVHEQWKLVPGHMGNGGNVQPRHDKPVLKRARVLGREGHDLPHGTHASAGVPHARGVSREELARYRPRRPRTRAGALARPAHTGRSRSVRRLP